jgi:hypothetical protein
MLRRVHRLRDRRDAVMLKGTALRSNGRCMAVEMINLSLHGCCLQTDEPLKPGESVRVQVGPLKGVAASVRWSRFETTGFSFDEGDWT